MGDGLSATGPESPPSAANGEPGTVGPDHEPVTRPRLGDAGDTAGAETPGQVVRRRLGDATHEAATGVPGHEPVTQPRLGDATHEAATGVPGHEPVTQRRLGDATHEAATGVPGHEPVTRPRLGSTADTAGAETPGQVTRPRLGDAAGLPLHPPTKVASQPADAPVEPPVAAVPGDLVRYGPGVPAGPPAAGAELTAERVWRGGPPPKRRRRARVLKVLGYALTIILLAASGVLFYLRFHHAPLDVTRVAIVRSGSAACSVTVTGRISTNGGAGTVTYQWLFPVGPPQTLQQSVSAGQSAVDVKLNVEGTGHGMTSQRISLQVLRPDRRIASEYIVLSCT